MDENELLNYMLAPDVFYRKTPDGDVVLYQTTKQNVFLLDGQIYDLLDLFRQNRLKKKSASLSEYHLGNYSRELINETVTQLLEMGWISGQTVLEEKYNTLESTVKIEQYGKGFSLSDAQFELTYRCNERCRHCYCPRENDADKELTTAEIKHVLDDLRAMQVISVTFTGGELFVRKDTFEILEYAYKLGFCINIFTNGTLLNDADFFRLKALYPRSVHFSVYNCTAEKHDAFTRLNGSFDKTISAIKKCKMLGIPTNMKVSLVEDNYADIEGICELAKSLGTTIQISMQIMPKNDGNMEPTKLRINNVNRYVDVMKRIDKHILMSCAGDFLHFEDKSDGGPICGAGKFSLNINPYGEVTACNALLLSCGNVREQSIRDIWEKSDTLKRIRGFKMTQLKGCEGCKMKSKCDFCPGSAMQENGDPLKRYSEACLITEAKIKNRKEDNLNGHY